MTILTPANAGQLKRGPDGKYLDPLGPASCVSYSFGYASSDASNGAVHPTGQTIREWTGDAKGGLELDQCDLAMHDHTDLEFETVVMSRSAFIDRIGTGKEGAVVLIGYGPISDSKFSGQYGFNGNHGMYLPPSFKAMDPLADGRRPGIYEYHGEEYPQSLVWDAIAALRLSNGRPAGPNHVEASFIALEAEVPVPVVHTASVSAGKVTFYRLENGVARPVATRRTGGFSGTCTPPHLYRWTSSPGGPIHSSRLRLVSMTSGAYSQGVYRGLYLNANNPNVAVTP